MEILRFLLEISLSIDEKHSRHDKSDFSNLLTNLRTQMKVHNTISSVRHAILFVFDLQQIQDNDTIYSVSDVM